MPDMRPASVQASLVRPVLRDDPRAVSGIMAQKVKEMPKVPAGERKEQTNEHHRKAVSESN